MSLEKNNEFLNEYNILDDMLKDMYPSEERSRLGVSRYIDNMKAKENVGREKLPNWKNDYDRLRDLRNKRTKAVHDNLLDSDLFDDDDIEWVVDFRESVCNQTDPLSLLFKLEKKKKKSNEKKEEAQISLEFDEDDEIYSEYMNMNLEYDIEKRLLFFGLLLLAILVIVFFSIFSK